jgi:hypothetical protein
MNEEFYNDIILFCKEKNTNINKNIKFNTYSQNLIKSSYKSDKINLIENCDHIKSYDIHREIPNKIYSNFTLTYLRFFFSKKTKFRVKVRKMNSNYFFFGFGNYINKQGDGIYYYPKEHEIFETHIDRKSINHKYLKGFKFELNKKIGIKYSKIDKAIYFYMDGNRYIFYDNYVMPKNYRAAVTCSGYKDSFKVYNFKK